MKREKLEKFIQHQNEIYNKNYYAYQETGIPRYKYAADKADELAEIAAQALSSVDDHDKCLFYKVELQDLAYRAREVLAGSDDLVVGILNDIIALGGH